MHFCFLSLHRLSTCVHARHIHTFIYFDLFASNLDQDVSIWSMSKREKQTLRLEINVVHLCVIMKYDLNLESEFLCK